MGIGLGGVSLTFFVSFTFKYKQMEPFVFHFDYVFDEHKIGWLFKSSAASATKVISGEYIVGLKLVLNYTSDQGNWQNSV